MYGDFSFEGTGLAHVPPCLHIPIALFDLALECFRDFIFFFKNLLSIGFYRPKTTRKTRRFSRLSFSQEIWNSKATHQKKFDDLTKGNVTGGTARRPITPLGKQVARAAQPIPAHVAPPPATAQPVATEQPHTTIDVDAETATSIAQAALEEVSVKEIDNDNIIWCAFSEMQTARGMTSSSKIMAEGAKLQASQGKQKRPQGR